MDPFDVLWNLRRSMDFPAVPIGESHQNSEGLRILSHAANYILQGQMELSATYRLMKLEGAVNA